MKSSPTVARFALMSLLLASALARAQFDPPASDIADDAPAATDDLVFDSDFDGPRNGGTTCESAIELVGARTYSADTTTTMNWMSTFGPLFSPSNDVIYKFVAGSDISGSITATVSNYSFAMYLLPTCSDTGAEPPPIGATATIGHGIDLEQANLVSGNTYYLAVTGSAAAGGGANGFLNFTTPRGLTRVR